MFEICLKNREECVNRSKSIHKVFVEKGVNPGSVADLIAIMISLYRLERILKKYRYDVAADRPFSP